MSIRPAENSTLDIRHVIGIGTPKAVDLWLDVVTELPDRARELGSLSKAELGKLGPLLDGTNAVELFESIDDKLAAEALHAMDPSLAATFLEALDSDHAANILREFKEPKREALLTLLPLERSDARTTAYVYVTDADSHLLGVIAFRALVLANPEQRVRELMGDDLIVVSPLTDKELAAQTIMGHNLMAVPVVDADNRLLGIIAEDEAIDIAEEEATEDAERQGGSAPLEVPYLRASPWLLWRKRVVWLLVLFAAEAYTGSVLRAFSDEMEAVIALAFFIPLLIGTGGNTGTQIATTLVRAMATGQVRFRDVPAVLAKELSTGVLVGLTMAAAAVVRAWTLGVGPQVTLTVALTVAAIVVWSSLVAAVLPPLLKKLRIDPAIVSGPMIATIVDGTGLLIYFLVAHLTLTELHGL